MLQTARQHRALGHDLAGELRLGARPLLIIQSILQTASQKAVSCISHLGCGRSTGGCAHGYSSWPVCESQSSEALVNRRPPRKSPLAGTADRSIEIEKAAAIADALPADKGVQAMSLLRRRGFQCVLQRTSFDTCRAHRYNHKTLHRGAACCASCLFT